jgi:hypothetical protein
LPASLRRHWLYIRDRKVDIPFNIRNHFRGKTKISISGEEEYKGMLYVPKMIYITRCFSNEPPYPPLSAGASDGLYSLRSPLSSSERI